MTSPERGKDEALVRALDEAGGPAEVVRFINDHYDQKVTIQAVCGWKVTPPRRVLQLEAAVMAKGGKTKRHDLCPKLYPAEKVMKAAAA